MNHNDDDRQLSLFLFPEDEKKEEKSTIVYNSEEDALVEILEQNIPEENDPPVLDPGDIPGAVVPLPEHVMKKKAVSLNVKLLRRAALAFLAGKNPDGLAANVYLPVIHAPADAVSFSLSGADITGTTIALSAETPVRMAMPADKKNALAQELSLQLERKEALEAQIRETEPQLNASLFADAAVWEYEKSRNGKYHRCLKKMEKIRHELQYSGKLERLIADKAADELYLILPEGTDYSAVPEEWGIVLVSPEDFSIKEVRAASRLAAESSAREALVKTTAVAARASVLFAGGIQFNKNGKPVLSPVPRKRTPYFL